MTIRSRIDQYVKEQKVGQYINEHKELYTHIVVGVGISAFTALVLRGRSAPIDGSTKTNARTINILSRNSGNVVSVIEREGRGHPGYPVWCMETLESFLTQGSAARYAGVDSKTMSYHIRGLIPDINGQHFKRFS